MPQAGDGGTHLAGGRGDRQGWGAMAPHAGLAWPVASAGWDGTAQPSEVEGGPEPLSGSLDAEMTTEKGKK